MRNTKNDMELGKLVLDKRAMPDREMSEFETCLLRGLWDEIERIYGNEYQTELDNYGTARDSKNIFSKQGIKWIPYDWGDEPSNEPNLVVNGKSFWWYKYFHRGLTTNSEVKISEEWFEESLKLIRLCETD